MIVIRTPLRLSFVGGDSDLKAFYEKKDGMVLGSSIDKFVYVIVKERFYIIRE
jgi:D-glycero-alpha-D-manno-heptose-7-phosphate kinase